MRLDVFVVRRIIRVGEADQPSGLDQEEVVPSMNMFLERLPRRHGQVPHAHLLVLELEPGADMFGWFSRHTPSQVRNPLHAGALRST